MGLTIADFRAMSTGTYNAGMLVLNKNNKLDMVNNHVKMTFLNNKKLSGDQILAVKNAFIEAVNNKVESNQLQEIRTRLGPPASDSADPIDTSKLKPLTREDVRQIISQYNLGDDRKNADEGKRAIGQDVTDRTMKHLYTDVAVGDNVAAGDNAVVDNAENADAGPESNKVIEKGVEDSGQKVSGQNHIDSEPPPGMWRKAGAAALVRRKEKRVEGKVRKISSRKQGVHR